VKNKEPAIPLKNLTPDMAAFINSLREKNGLKRVKTVDDYINEIRSLKEEVRRLESMIENSEKTYLRESDRLEGFLRMLTTVSGSDLKKAVSLIVYWDRFSWLDCGIVERMREASERFKAFFDLPRNYGNIKVMMKFSNTKELAAALKKFGYGDKADERTRAIKQRERKSKKKGSK